MFETVPDPSCYCKVVNVLLTGVVSSVVLVVSSVLWCARYTSASVDVNLTTDVFQVKIRRRDRQCNQSHVQKYSRFKKILARGANVRNYSLRLS